MTYQQILNNLVMHYYLKTIFLFFQTIVYNSVQGQSPSTPRRKDDNNKDKGKKKKFELPIPPNTLGKKKLHYGPDVAMKIPAGEYLICLKNINLY